MSVRTVRRAPTARRKKPAAAKPAAQHVHHVIPSHLLHPDDKRELILAHVHARRAKQPQALGFLYYTSIAAAFLLVVTGWWLTLGKNLRAGESISTVPDPVIQIVQQGGQQFSDQWHAGSQNLADIKAGQAQFTQSAQAYRAEVLQQELIQKTADNIKRHTSSTPDLYHP